VEITVSGRHVEVPAALRAAAVEKIGRLEKYLDGIERADVHFTAENQRRPGSASMCEVTLQGNGHIVRAKALAPDRYAAIDGAVDKLEHQLHRLKSRLVAKHHGNHKGAKARVAAGPDQDEDEAEGAAAGLPPVVKRKRFVLKPMTEEEAVLQMELLGHQFFFFNDADSGGPAVVYRRDDGDIGLIEPER
jgi:putative sigma-54 modulation protein